MQSPSINHKAFIVLVRAGLWESEVGLRLSEAVDYTRVLSLAEEQSVVGLVTAGIEHIPNTKIPKVIALQFVGQALQQEQRNALMNKYIVFLVNLLRSHNIYCVLVKGQGVAQCYERPLWRACGDIDLYLNKSDFINARQLLCPMAQKVEPDNDVTDHINLVMKEGGWVVELHANQHTDLSFRVDKELEKVHNSVFLRGKLELGTTVGR